MSLSELSKQRIRPLLELNDRLRSLAANEEDINMSSIIVVGDQSHGKSSVVESLSGIKLPRGEGIVTRLPLVLMLRQLTNPDVSGEYAEISAAQAPTFHGRVELEKIAQEVETITEVLAGGGTDVQDKEVEITVYRKDQDDLTIIDLPGMTRVALKGQHSGIEKTITDMYRRYMTKPETVMLNVVQSTVDITTSQSLKLSLEHDPQGTRTLLCLSKVDQRVAEDGSLGLDDVVKRISSNMKIDMDNIYLVRNRSQGEIEAEMSHKEAFSRETQFFESCKELQKVPSSMKGSRALSSRLVQLQAERVQSVFPEVAKKIKERRIELLAEVRELEGKAGVKSEWDAKSSVMKMVNTFSFRLRNIAGVAGEDMEVLEEHLRLKNFTNHKLYPSHFQVEMDLSEKEMVLFRKEDKKSPGYVASPPKSIFSKDYASICHGIHFAMKVKGPAGDVCGCVYYADSESTQIESIETYMNFSVTSHNGKTLKDEGLSYTFTEVPSEHGKGELLEGIDNAVRIVLTVVIKKITFKDIRNEPPVSIRTNFYYHRKAFTKTMSSLYDDAYFFQKSYAEFIKVQMAKYCGEDVFPSDIEHQAGRVLVKHLLIPLPGLIKGLLEKVNNDISEATTQLFESVFNGYPVALRAVLQITETVLAEANTRLEDALEDTLEFEMTLFTENDHYFRATMKKIEEALDLTDDEGEMPPILFIKASTDILNLKKLGILKSSKNRSVKEERVFKLQVKLYSYWKVVRKRLVDWILMCVRSHLIKRVFCKMGKYSLAENLSEQILRLGESHGYQKLLLRSNETRARYEVVKKRLAALDEAYQLLVSSELQDEPSSEKGSASHTTCSAKGRREEWEWLDSDFL
eukprot:Nk52_evm14s287 gene=Nk52_evmTU14s287